MECKHGPILYGSRCLSCERDTAKGDRNVKNSKTLEALARLANKETTIHGTNWRLGDYFEEAFAEVEQALLEALTEKAREDEGDPGGLGAALAERYKVEETDPQLLGVADDIDGRRDAAVQIAAHRVQYRPREEPVAYPADTIGGLQPGTKYWILSDEGARRGEPTRYLALTDTREVCALQGHRLLGTVTTPN